jgi:hypothetical protein
VSNLEAVEMGLREALFKDGRQLLEQLYQDPQLSVPQNTSQPGEKCHPARSKGIHTLFGRMELSRSYFYCPITHQGRVPLDEALGLTESYSPGLVRLASRAAARQGYEAASQDLAALAGIRLEGRQIQRIVNQAGPPIARQLAATTEEVLGPIPILYVEVDGTGVPMVPAELVGRQGKQPDGSAKTQEVKLACLFTQTTTDAEGRPLRDYQSTTYVAGFETAEVFGGRVRAEAQRRGLGQACVVIFIGDGAAWIWELARINFPFAIMILDLYHALEHLHQLCLGLYGVQGPWAQRMKDQWRQMLEKDQVAEVIAVARHRLQDLGPQADETLEKQIAYFEHNQSRMLYGTYRKAGYFYGSGVVEAGCKTVIGQRLKQSGMFWTRSGAESVLALRCALMGNRWDECWDRIHHSDYLKIKTAA